MKKQSSKRLTRSQRAELTALAALPDDAVDTSDAPELLDWSGAKRGLFYRSVKQQLTLRLDSDVVAWFKSHATSHEGYQTRINRALREYVQGRGNTGSPIWRLMRFQSYRPSSIGLALRSPRSGRLEGRPRATPHQIPPLHAVAARIISRDTAQRIGAGYYLSGRKIKDAVLELQIEKSLGDDGHSLGLGTVARTTVRLAARQLRKP